MTKTLIWDFDGTLGYREGGMFGASLQEVVRRQAPQASPSLAAFRPHLRAGFPWHNWQQPHPHITTADEWWEWINPIFERALTAGGIEPEQAKAMARKVRPVYTDLERWRLFDDVLPTLGRLAERGWSHVILSNHVPELHQIVEHLRLSPYLDKVFNSAELGYEKPHPQAFQIVLESLPHTENIWMVGDNIKADVIGAKAAGIPAILVRKYSKEAEFYCESLTQVPAVVQAQAGTKSCQWGKK